MNGPDDLTRETAHVFIHLVRYLLQSLVSRSFLMRLRLSFLIFFFHLRLFEGIRFQYLRVRVVFLFFRTFLFLIWQLYSFCYLLLFIMSMAHVLCQIPFLYPGCIFLLLSPSPSCSLVFLVLWQDLSTCFSFVFFKFLPYGQPVIDWLSFFLLNITRSGLLAGIKESVCVSKSQRILCVSFSRTDFGLCIYHFVHYVTLLRVSQTRVCWWSSRGFLVIASLLKFPGLFSVFWTILIML